MPISKISKISKSFECKTCNYVCSKNSEYTKHLNTAKHKRLTNPNNEAIDTSAKYPKTYICKCGNEYKHLSSLSKHKKSCNNTMTTQSNIVVTQDTVENLDENKDKESLILSLITQNKELMNLLQVQSTTLQKQSTTMQVQSTTLQEQTKTIQEMIPKMGNTTNNNTNKFNLQVFLNEDCKDAINFSDFIESIQVSIEDLENQAQVGYVAGISKLFLENMKELGINKRPIHCTDKKRNTLYIKENDEWDKEGSQDQLLQGIKVVTGRAHQTLCDLKEENPEEYSDIDSDFSNKCMNIQRNLLPGFPRESTFGKVIDSISGGSVVDREP
jgi:hypothetical protein